MITADFETQARRLLDFACQKIPLARALAMDYQHYDGQRLELKLPLAPNINDKGCAFGGSLASAMTLTGWSLMELALRQAGADCDVFVAESKIRYLAPIWEDSTSAAQPGERADWTRFFATLRRHGKARLMVSGEVLTAAGKRAATLEANYAAKRR
ncbi:thioesterase-like protein [Lasius niger]|uniref:Thioesterase-like protein n=1 Tax=Lasius niger TaxID=67767 RepID=A0A0J7JZJ2_LASNI|nr:thioesterase-like protein [Lasius niger]